MDFECFNLAIWQINKNGNVNTVAESYSVIICSPLVNTENHKLQETLRQFYETLVCHMFFKCDEMS